MSLSKKQRTKQYKDRSTLNRLTCCYVLERQPIKLYCFNLLQQSNLINRTSEILSLARLLKTKVRRLFTLSTKIY